MTLVEKLDEITETEADKMDAAAREAGVAAMDLPTEMLANIRDVALWEGIYAVARRLDEFSR